MTAARDPQGSKVQYAENLVPRVHAFLRRTVPRDAEVLVVSKGDRALVEVQGLRAGHFPQRGDGVYAGYYPRTSAAAIEHLETLRERGAEFIVFPATAFWWLEHYDALRAHLDSRYRLIARDEQVAALYALFELGTRVVPAARRSRSARRPRAELAPVPDHAVEQPLARGPLAGLIEEQFADDVRALFDREHYAAQAGIDAGPADHALAHYLGEGHEHALSPHPLFDVGWYLRHNPDAALPGSNPLLHFVRHGADRRLDPNPYFDSAYYYEQAAGAGRHIGLALVHYLRTAAANQSYHPNPLFRDGFYLRSYGDATECGSPLEHYLRSGWRAGRFASHLHQEMAQQLFKSQSGLIRGNWKAGTVLFLVGGAHRPGAPDIVAIADELAARLRVDSVIIAAKRADVVERMPSASRLLVLEDFELASEVQRPSARRLLIKSLAGAEPLFAVAETPELLEVLRDHGIGTYFALPGPGELPSRSELAEIFARASRVIVPSTEAFAAAAEQLSVHPVNVALRSPDSDRYADSLIELGRRDFGLDPGLGRADRAAVPQRTRRLVIPCSDWSVSGVNASLEALGGELMARGWEVEILFTRDEEWVSRSAHEGAHMPGLPYRILRRRRPGIEGMWEALIAELERSAPAIVLSAYDFLANGVIPALSDQLGVAMWVQADDGDYYEQVYRLGRYCDAIVCVSRSIRDKLVALNPALEDRAHVIHNSSIHVHDVVARRPDRTKLLRIVYAGRLVQYQKRVLEFVDLARSLDRTGVQYEIALIGAFPAAGEVEEAFRQAAAEHLASGRIRLAGRLSRQEILAELDSSDLFVLLSDFEGLPLALVEAMARGCVPVAAEMESGIPEIVRDGDNGLIITGRDYDAWARLIVELFANRRRLARMSKRARSTVRSRFTVEEAADRFEAVLQPLGRLAAAASPRRPPALHWGHERSWTGDVLPPPSIVRPSAVNLGGLR